MIWDDWEGGTKNPKTKGGTAGKGYAARSKFALADCALAKTQCDLFRVTGRMRIVSTSIWQRKPPRPHYGSVRIWARRIGLLLLLCQPSIGDFDRARDELVIARRTLPNNSEALVIGARIDRRQNRWDASLANFQKASELDPRNSEVAWHRGLALFDMRRYYEWEQLLAKDAESGDKRTLDSA